jgi:hypothetical protein
MLTGIWQSLRGSYLASDCFVRELPDGRVYWLESAQGIRGFSRVFRGIRKGSSVSGKFYDVPRGVSSRSGDLVVEITHKDGQMRFAGSGRVLTKRQNGFVRARPGAAPPLIDGFFVGRGMDNLSGTYRRGNDSAVYYVMEPPVLVASASTDIAWFAHHPASQYAHVFVGRRSGTEISGEWADLPGLSQQEGFGSIDDYEVIDLLDGSRPELRAVAIGRGPRAEREMVATRYETILTNIRYQSLTIAFPDEAADEPFVWLAVVKFDGESFNVIADGSNTTSSRVQVLASPGGHKNIVDFSVGKGAKLPIPPEIGTFRNVRLRSIGGLDPTNARARQLSMIVLIAIGLEEDNTTDADIEAVHNVFVAELRHQLIAMIDSLILGLVSTGAIDPAAFQAALDRVKRNMEDTIKHAAFEEGDIVSGIDPDDRIGLKFQQLSLDSLDTPALSSGSINYPFTLRLLRRHKRPVYVIDGWIEVIHAPRRLYERFGGYMDPQLVGYIFDPNLPAPADTVPLRRWRGEERHDSFTTSNPAYADPVRDSFSPGYELSRGTPGGLQGYIFDPRLLSAPTNTVPLRSWWSHGMQDNWTAVDFSSGTEPTIEQSPDYKLIEHYPLEGYVFDPRLPRPRGTVPLVRWWSPSQTDNLTSSEPGWRIE